MQASGQAVQAPKESDSRTSQESLRAELSTQRELVTRLHSELAAGERTSLFAPEPLMSSHETCHRKRHMSLLTQSIITFPYPWMERFYSAIPLCWQFVSLVESMFPLVHSCYPGMLFLSAAACVSPSV